MKYVIRTLRAKSSNKSLWTEGPLEIAIVLENTKEIEVIDRHIFRQFAIRTMPNKAYNGVTDTAWGD